MTRPRGPRVRFALAAFLAAGAALGAASVLGLGGCGRESPTATSARVPLEIRVVYVDPSAAAVKENAPRSPSAPHAPAAVESVRASAYEVGPEPPILRASAATAVAPGDTSFRLVLSVPPAERYSIVVEILGVADDSSGASEFGTTWSGQVAVSDVTGLTTRSVTVPTSATLPRLGWEVDVAFQHRLEWTAVSGAARYRVRGMLPGAPVREFVTEETSIVLSDPPGLRAPDAAAGAAILYRVRAELENGVIGAYSNSVEVPVAPSEPPAAVTDLRVVELASTSVRLAWTATGDDGAVGTASAYDVRFSGTPIDASNFPSATPVEGEPVPKPAGQPENMAVTGLAPGAVYHFAMTVADEVPNVSALSNLATATTLPIPGGPDAVADLAVTGVGPASVTLAWSAPSDDGAPADAYDLRFDTVLITPASFEGAQPVSGLPAPGAPGSPQSMIVGSLSPGITYYFALLSLDDQSLPSPLSNGVSATTVDVPAAPLNLVAEALSDSSIRIVWSDRSTDEDVFEIERSDAGPNELDPIAEVPGTDGDSSSFIDSGLPERTSFAYRVRARNAAGVSAYSNTAGARTSIRAPVALGVETLSESALRLSWSFGILDVNTFRIERYSELAGWLEIAQPSGAVRTYDDAGLLPDATYSYRLRAAEGEDLSAYSNVVSGTTAGPPVCLTNPDSIDFGSLAVGESAAIPVTVVNDGGGTVDGNATLDCSSFAFLDGGGPFTLAAGETIRILVDFVPADSGEVACNLSLGGECTPVALLGRGVHTCAVDPESLMFGSIAIGSQAQELLIIRNLAGVGLLGQVPATCGAFSFAPPGGFMVPVGDSMLVTVTYEPDDPIADTCSIDVGNCPMIHCTGEAAPRCSLSTAALDFGRVSVPSAKDVSFTVTNVGGGTLSGSFDLECSDFAEVAGTTYSLGPMEFQIVTLRYQPQSPGVDTCQISAGSDCGAMVLTGDTPPQCAAIPPSLDFGTVAVGDSAFLTFQLTNLGGGTLSGITIGAQLCIGTGFSIASGGVAPYPDLTHGEFHDVTVRYKPQEPGSNTCQVATGTVAGCPLVTCTGNTGPQCAVSTNLIDFGDAAVGQPHDRTFTISNIGGGTLTGALSVAGCSDFKQSVTSFSIAAGQDTVVTVTYTPSGTGPDNCTLQLTGVPDCPNVTLVGNAPLCLILPAPSLFFGSYPCPPAFPEIFVEKTFTVRNQSGTSLTLNVSGFPADSMDFLDNLFEILSVSDNTLNNGESAQITIQFRVPPDVPTGIGDFIVTTGGPCPSIVCTGQILCGPPPGEP